MSKYTEKKYELEAIMKACERLEEEAKGYEYQAEEYKKRAKENDEDEYYKNEAKDWESRATGTRNGAERIFACIKDK